MSNIRTGRKLACCAVACVASVLASAGIASAQSHGVRIGKSCESPKCRGVATDCTIQVGHDDGFGDSVSIIEAWDVIDPDGSETRVPAVGNLPIINVEGNTTCTVGGSLPCLLCDGGVTCGGNPPISSDPGTVVFRSNTYVIQAGDPDPLEDQANIRVQDQCDAPGTSGCSSIINRIQFTAATEITDCDDGNPCTTDACLDGVCSFTPDCESAADCSDGNVCTSDVCTAEGCCENPPLCTVNADCDDQDECTTDTCVAGCCRNVPDCTADDDCEDDGNLCTIEFCEDSCCGRRDVVCEDDGDPCTEENCNTETGVCDSTPIEPPPPGCGEEFAGCTPGFWKQPHHLQYWPAPYDPTDTVNATFGVSATGNPTLLKALSTGGGGEIAFLRHAVSALLNSARDDVNYFYSTAQVISMVQEAYATGNFQHFHSLFAEQNELGCTVVKINDPRSGDRSGPKGDR